jgi:tetratricopeptide (TPR) repeat protein
MAGRNKVPNSTFRRFREVERQQSRAEFAEALAGLARELHEPISPSERYIARLEDGEIRYPSAPYRRVLVALSKRSMAELGFSNRISDRHTPALDKATESTEFAVGVPARTRLATLPGGNMSDIGNLAMRSDWPVWFGVRIAHLVAMIDNWRDASDQFETLQTILHQEVLMFDVVASSEQSEIPDILHAFSRRQALTTLAALPLSAVLPLRTKSEAGAVDAFLTRCASSLTACWHLLRGADMNTACQAISGYIISLEGIAGQRSVYQETAARLASQAHRILGIVALHRDQLKARETHCKRALYYAGIADDPGSRVSALISLASTYFYASKPSQAAAVYERALALQSDVSPLQLSRVHAELAVVYGQVGREQDAVRAIGRSAELYPDDPEHDRSYLYAEFTPASLTLEHGLAYIALADQRPGSSHAAKATEVFSRLTDYGSSMPDRIRFEIVNHQASNAVHLNDLDSFIFFMTSALEGISLLGSAQREKEAAGAWALAARRWPSETRLAALRPMIQLAKADDSEEG